MRIAKTLCVLGILRIAQSACPNRCSGHGVCDINDQCQCYLEAKTLNEDGNENPEILRPQWTGADCSQLTCARGVSWTHVNTIKGHSYGAECSDAGICNRVTGNCECFAGFEGQACSRTTCPNDCNGNGVCKSNEQFAESYARKLSQKINTKFFTPVCDGVDISSGDDYSAETCTRNLAQLEDYFNTYMVTYNQAWDSGLQYGCECDIGFTGADCSLRECPSTNDVGDPFCDGIEMDTEEWSTIDTNDEAISLSSEYKMYLDLYSNGQSVFNVPEEFKINYRHYDDYGRSCRAPHMAKTWLAGGTEKKTMARSITNEAYILLINADSVNCGPEWQPFSLKVPFCNGKLSGIECSGRGICNRINGQCECFGGYAGIACNEVEELA